LSFIPIGLLFPPSPVSVQVFLPLVSEPTVRTKPYYRACMVALQKLETPFMTHGGNLIL
jgi:hypothetical protein